MVLPRRLGPSTNHTPSWPSPGDQRGVAGFGKRSRHRNPESRHAHHSRTPEKLTLQCAAYVTEAQAHGDLALPALVQSPDELAAELIDPQVLALGLLEGARLVAAVRVHIEDETAELGRLVVAPDRQGRGLGSRLLREAEEQVPDRVQLLRLFTGEYSHANQRLYQ